MLLSGIIEGGEDTSVFVNGMAGFNERRCKNWYSRVSLGLMSSLLLREVAVRLEAATHTDEKIVHHLNNSEGQDCHTMR